MSKIDKAIEDAEKAKGWKIDLRPYKHEKFLFNENGNPVMKGTEQVMETTDFDVKESLAGLCFNRDMMLEVEDMFKAKEIADKIRGAKNSVILDTAQMEHIRKGYKLLKGLPEDFVEFLERIRDAEEVSLKEATPEG